jgi:predicted dehydrogenase
VKRDDLVTIQVDGTHGSAVAGLRECRIQPYAATPKPVWNPDIPSPINYYDGWTLLPQTTSDENGFKVQWEMFIRHVLCGTPWKHTLLEGAKGVQLAECGIKSWRERRWIDIDDISENAEHSA